MTEAESKEFRDRLKVVIRQSDQAIRRKCRAWTSEDWSEAELSRIRKSPRPILNDYSGTTA